MTESRDELIFPSKYDTSMSYEGCTQGNRYHTEYPTSVELAKF